MVKITTIESDYLDSCVLAAAAAGLVFVCEGCKKNCACGHAAVLRHSSARLTKLFKGVLIVVRSGLIHEN